MYTAKNLDDFTLVDNPESPATGRLISFAIKQCNNATSATPCADFGPGDEHLQAYLKKHKLVSYSMLSFVDYENVEPGVGPLVQIPKAQEPL